MSGPSAVASVRVAPDSATLRAVGDTVRFSATARTAAGDTVGDVTFTWASGSTSVARVSATGLVTAVNVGAATIAVTAPGGAADSASVVVLAALANSVAVSPAGMSLSGAGASASLAAEFRNGQGQVVSGKTFSWTSLNPAVATVSGAGVVTAVAPGQATIAATADGVTGYGLATVAVADAAALPVFAPMPSGTTANLRAIWGSSAGNVFAVGTGGTTLHFDGTGWSAMTSGTTADLTGVWGASATDVFVVGDAGTILHWNGTRWESMRSPTFLRLNGVWGSSPVDVYAVASIAGQAWGVDPLSSLLHWDGDAWRYVSWLGTSKYVHAIWGTSSSDIYAVALTSFGFLMDCSGTLLHLEAASWSDLSGPCVSLSGVWGASSAVTFAAGYWQIPTGGPGYRTVPTVLRRSGTQWVADTLPPGITYALNRAVWGTGPANVFVVGDAGRVHHWDGSTWARGLVLPGAPDLYGVWGASPMEVFAVGDRGTILRSVPGGTVAVTPATATAPAFGGTVSFTATVRDGAGSPVSGVALAWTTSDSSVAVPDSTGLVTVARAGTATITATAQGGASASATLTVSTAATVTPDGVTLTGFGASATLHVVCGASGGSCAGTVEWSSLNPAVATVDGAGVVTAVAAGQATVGATANGATAYALVTVSVPQAAPVARWTAMATGTTQSLAEVWGTAATNVYAVGETGAVVRFDGATWTPVASGTTRDIVRLWGASATDLYAASIWLDLSPYRPTYRLQVGRSNGSAWTAWEVWESNQYPAPSAAMWGASPRALFVGRWLFDGFRREATDLSVWPWFGAGDIWGTSARNAFAVGWGGRIKRYDGSSWSSMAGGMGQDLAAVWGTSATDVFAVGAGGTILHFDGLAWAPMVSGTTLALNGVWGTSPANVYAIGASGTILHYDGTSWTSMASGTTSTLFGIWGTTPTTVFVVGSGGTILQGTPRAAARRGYAIDG